MNKKAIIVAGGKGLRMGAEIPKQFIEVAGMPILMHSILAFYQYDNSIEIIVVLPESQMKYWEGLCDKYNFEIGHRVVAGGEERYHSVLNGLNAIADDNSVVAIHDGVRPLVSPSTIDNCYKSVSQNRGAVPVVLISDSIRIVEGSNSRHIDRSFYRAVQTPQTFLTVDIKSAYKNGYKPFFTDDASVFEANKGAVQLVEGNKANVKITTPEDIVFFEAIVKAKKN